MKTKPVFWILLVLVTVVFLISPVVAAVPVASFISNVSSGTIPLTVQFMDISLNTPTSWTWLFGDGGISSSQDPTHTYTTAGTYTVTLIATNTAGSNTHYKCWIYYRNEGFIRAHRFLLDEYHIRVSTSYYSIRGLLDQLPEFMGMVLWGWGSLHKSQPGTYLYNPGSVYRHTHCNKLCGQ